jgi:hypothetical protein
MLDKLKKLEKKLDHILSTSTEERRREAREDLTDATAEIAGQRYPIRNWSAHGFCIGPSLMTPKPGDRLDINFSIPLPDRRLEFSCRVGVMRYDKERQEFGGVFFNLDEEIQDIVDEHFQVFSAKRYGKDLLQNLRTSLRRE